MPVNTDMPDDRDRRIYYDLCPFTTHSESKQTMVHYSVKHVVSPLCGPSSDELQLPQAI